MPLRPPKEQSVAGAVAIFAVTGFAVVALLGLAAVEVLRTTATSESLRDARELTELAGKAVVAPAIDDGLAQGRPSSQRRVARVVDRFLISKSVVRVKIWTDDGTIVWSNEPRLIGAHYALRDDELEALKAQHVVADVSDLHRSENRFERRYGRLLEVSGGVTSPTGQRLLLETYVRSSAIEASGERLWKRFAPALVIALVLLELIQIPLAFILARRLRERQRERSALLERAIDASEEERRTIAASLHDGPVQQLAGVAFSLGAASRDHQLTPDQHTQVISDAAAQVRSTIRDLRATLVDLYPASLHRSGLEAALADLLAPLQEANVETSCEVDPNLDLTERQERLLFRGAREAIRNVAKHARAGRVDVEICRRGGAGVDLDRRRRRRLRPDRRAAWSLRSQAAARPGCR